MDRFFCPVIINTYSIPTEASSSTMYWIQGLLAMGIISFGCVLVKGSILVPSPAAGMTAFLII